MIESIVLPQELNSSIGSESKDFVVKANRAQPLKISLSLASFGFMFLIIPTIIVIVILMQILQGKEIPMEVMGNPVVVSSENLKPIILPAVIVLLFILAGAGILGYGIYLIFKKGGYFVGTPTRLIKYQKNNIRSIDWEQFTGDIQVSGDAQKGDITLQMRTGKMHHRKNRPDVYVPDVIYIAGIPNIYEIEQICRKRIKENDPTPTSK